MVDVDVQDMGGTTASLPAITVFNGTDSGNNGANWTFDPNCPTALSISPAVVNVASTGTQTFTAGGGGAPYTFSVAVNNSGATINATTGEYTAGNTDNMTDTVRVTDAFGSIADATVNVTSITISGKVTQNGSAFRVLIRLSGSRTAQTVTDTQGSYAFSNLPGGGNYTVTPVEPSFSDFDFTPANRSYTNLLSDQTAQDFVAVKNRFTISGSVSSNFEGGLYPLGGVLVTLSGDASNTTTTDFNGHYRFGGMPAGSYTVTPTKTAFSITPASAPTTITNQDVTANFTAQGPPGLTGRIVFAEATGAQGINNSGALKSMNADGSGLVTLFTPYDLSNLSPAFSADGKRVAFARYNGTTSWDIFVSNFDGTNASNLTNNNLFEVGPVWSSDGQKIAFDRGFVPSSPGVTFFTMNADGANQTEVPVSLNEGQVAPPWAPD